MSITEQNVHNLKGKSHENSILSHFSAACLDLVQRETTIKILCFVRGEQHCILFQKKLIFGDFGVHIELCLRGRCDLAAELSLGITGNHWEHRKQLVLLDIILSSGHLFHENDRKPNPQIQRKFDRVIFQLPITTKGGKTPSQFFHTKQST